LSVNALERAQLRTFLRRFPPQIPARWLYDTKGADLFEDITMLEEYYPTRAEESILAHNAETIAEIAPAHTVVEIGAGSSKKVPLVLRALREINAGKLFVPIDISQVYLDSAKASLSELFPGLKVAPVRADFSDNLTLDYGEGPRLALFLGGTLGNFERDEVDGFLSGIFDQLEVGDSLLLGVDLVKDTKRLIRAYHDSQGITEAFIRNILDVAKREWGATIEQEWFDYRVDWNDTDSRIEMSLVAKEDLDIRIDDLGLDLALPAGDRILVETSHKFRVDEVSSLVERAGFTVAKLMSDADEEFLLALATKSE
jgi:L-histidine N-alpha-methyltransferase